MSIFRIPHQRGAPPYNDEGSGIYFLAIYLESIFQFLIHE